MLAGSPQAARCIGYLTKYLTKQIGTCHTATIGPESDHSARLAETLRWQPCSPGCANWLRYGIQPKNARPDQAPGACKGKAHDADHLGYAGRRVLCSCKWSGKTLADHRAAGLTGWWRANYRARFESVRTGMRSTIGHAAGTRAKVGRRDA